jgi:hypothetical protein
VGVLGAPRLVRRQQIEDRERGVDGDADPGADQRAAVRRRAVAELALDVVAPALDAAVLIAGASARGMINWNRDVRKESPRTIARALPSHAVSYQGTLIA